MQYDKQFIFGKNEMNNAEPILGESKSPNDSYTDLKSDFISGWFARKTNKTIENLPPNQIDKLFKDIQTSKYESASPKDALALFLKDLANESRVDVSTHDEGHQVYGAVPDYEKTLTTGEVKDLLDCSINTVKNRILQLKLAGKRESDRDAYLLPAWQFEGSQLVKGVDLILQEFEENGVATIRKMTTPLIDFDDKCIVELLREGNIKASLEAARLLKCSK